MKILAIGNSFSEDAMAYFYQIAQAGGDNIKAVNLYIGGCSLERHWNNVEGDIADYDYQLNGSHTGRKISIKEALLEEEWDIVTLQQCSGQSGLPESYYPYIEKLSEYVSSLVPHAKQWIHKTWAYEKDSNHEEYAYYDHSQDKMYEELTRAYELAAKKLSLPVIPCGDVIQYLRSLPAFDYGKGGLSLCRDGYHMNIPYGRYALALTWYKTLLHGDVLSNTFVPSAEGTETDAELLRTVREGVNACLASVK
ncbi:protein of unknown function [Anaerocolumna jejuensis DSM 15929]|uniref:DUF4886 domain-containing protein n=1 Tax=Anaerocolumna jejuensis DSM 15929 TaxID=1121322 RepID=A0A1M6PKH7_9FIRM|nr:DUF4886 domain-containing protein [Anaerocolumna jejuensis]SHK08496.1 protein of unknown function [Anaerocolumna jejuensis DSM 15929]